MRDDADRALVTEGFAVIRDERGGDDEPRLFAGWRSTPGGKARISAAGYVPMP